MGRVVPVLIIGHQPCPSAPPPPLAKYKTPNGFKAPPAAPHLQHFCSADHLLHLLRRPRALQAAGDLIQQPVDDVVGQQLRREPGGGGGSGRQGGLWEWDSSCRGRGRPGEAGGGRGRQRGGRGSAGAPHLHRVLLQQVGRLRVRGTQVEGHQLQQAGSSKGGVRHLAAQHTHPCHSPTTPPVAPHTARPSPRVLAATERTPVRSCPPPAAASPPLPTHPCADGSRQVDIAGGDGAHAQEGHLHCGAAAGQGHDGITHRLGRALQRGKGGGVSDRGRRSAGWPQDSLPSLRALLKAPGSLTRPQGPSQGPRVLDQAPGSFSRPQGP